MDSNHRSRRRQIYSLLPLTAREPNHIGAGERNRTFNLLITSQLLYRWATPANFCASRLLPFGWCLIGCRTPPCKRFARAVVLFAFRLVPRGGIEPPTRGFSVLCSTDWAIEAKLKFALSKLGDSDGARTHDL